MAGGARMTDVKRGENYERNGDMTPPGESRLIAHVQHDGDVCLQIFNTGTANGIDYCVTADIEFCASGGKSPNTLHALHALVAAMALDAERTR